VSHGGGGRPGDEYEFYDAALEASDEYQRHFFRFVEQAIVDLVRWRKRALMREKQQQQQQPQQHQQQQQQPQPQPQQPQQQPSSAEPWKGMTSPAGGGGGGGGGAVGADGGSHARRNGARGVGASA
jgi:hypothetical protein